MRTVNTVQGDDGGLSGKLPMTPQMQVGVQVFECVCVCVFLFLCLCLCLCVFFCVTGGKDDKP